MSTGQPAPSQRGRRDEHTDSVLVLHADERGLRWDRQRLSREQAVLWLRWRRPRVVELRLEDIVIHVPLQRLLEWLEREGRLDAAIRRELAYQTLSVPPESEPARIRHAYRKLARLHHPDRGGSPDAMRAVIQAYRRLQSRPPELVWLPELESPPEPAPAP